MNLRLTEFERFLWWFLGARFPGDLLPSEFLAHPYLTVLHGVSSGLTHCPLVVEESNVQNYFYTFT